MNHSAYDQFVIGVDIGGTLTRGAIVGRDGEVVLRLENPTDVTAGTKGIVAVVEELLGRAGDHQIAGVGVGAAGFIDASTGSVTFSPNLAYDDPNVADAVQARSGLPTIVDNDANVAALGERTFGSARGSDYVAYLTIGTGIGSGFIERGRLVRGFSGAGAELGHMIIDPDGPHCPCGLRGCFEQMASGTAIGRMGREAVANGPESSIVAFAGSVEAITGKHVAMAAREYDETAREVLRQAGRSLGIGLSNVVNLFDPEVIVLGGSVVRAGEPFLGPARDQLHKMNNAQRRRPMRIDVTSLEGDAGLMGAAALAFSALDEGRTTPHTGVS
ncbi:MAG: ROK family protein [Actinomycetota bacterium]|nr:ROK family protein [Actinomycetota bacterium]